MQAPTHSKNEYDNKQHIHHFAGSFQTIVVFASSVCENFANWFSVLEGDQDGAVQDNSEEQRDDIKHYKSESYVKVVCHFGVKFQSTVGFLLFIKDEPKAMEHWRSSSKGGKPHEGDCSVRNAVCEDAFKGEQDSEETVHSYEYKGQY